jgi:hypothetical protein
MEGKMGESQALWEIARLLDGIEYADATKAEQRIYEVLSKLGLLRLEYYDGCDPTYSGQMGYVGILEKEKKGS